MKKAIWLGASGLVLIGVVVAGVVFWPRLYLRWFSPATPLGKISKLETVETFRGGSGTMRAVEGNRLWVLHFEAGKGAQWQFGEKCESGIDIFLVDDKGEKHPIAGEEVDWLVEDGKIVVEGGKEVAKSRALVFSIPQDRQPRYIRFCDMPQVRLPAP